MYDLLLRLSVCQCVLQIHMFEGGIHSSGNEARHAVFSAWPSTALLVNHRRGGG